MTTVEYMASLFLAVIIAIVLSVWKQEKEKLPLRIGVGVLVGFSAFLIALMSAVTIGNIVLNAAVASVVISIVARKTWRQL